MKHQVAICGNNPGELWMHASAFNAIENVTVASIFTNDVSCNVKLTKKFDCEITDYFDSILEDKNISSVVITNPLNNRYERAVSALEKGKNVYLAPPFAPDSNTAEEIIRASKKSCALVMCGENWLFYPPVKKVLSLIKKKTVGKIAAARMRSLIAGSGGWDSYLNPDFRIDLTDEQQDKNEILFREIYEKLSLACSFMGPLKELYCIHQPGAGNETAAVIIWKHRTPGFFGALDITLSPDMNIRSAYQPRDDNIELTGSSGIIWMTMGSSQMKTEPTVKIYRGDKQHAYGNLDDDWIRGYQAAAEHFCQCVEKNKTPDIKPAQSSLLVRYAEAAIESAKTGQRYTF